MTDEELRAELDALRREIADLRRAAQPSPADGGATHGDGLDRLASLFQAAAGRIEETAAEHPIPAVLVSLLVGLLIGRRTAR